MLTVGEVLAFVDKIYPPALAEAWDSVGLVCGDRNAPVRRIQLAVDPVAATVDESIEAGAGLLITHHPLLLRGVTSVAADTVKGALIHRLIRNDVALFAAHTNADRARDGVNDALAACAGLLDTQPLQPVDLLLDKVVTFVPTPDSDRVLDALAAAGAGDVGDYSRCAFTSTGIGTFLPGSGAQPAIGTPGKIEHVDETRLEMVLPRHRRPAVLRALQTAHPYEEPAFDLLELVALPGDQGLGRIGSLPQPMRLDDFVRSLRLPATPVGIKVAGDPSRMVQRIAVVGGAGDSMLGATADADVLITADLRHHPALDAAESHGPALVDPGHWASEWPWLQRAASLIEMAFPDVECVVSRICTDPWTFHVAGGF